MSDLNESWFGQTQNDIKQWFQRPEVRSTLSKSGLILGVFGILLYTIFKEDDHPDNQIQAIAERLIGASRDFLMS